MGRHKLAQTMRDLEGQTGIGGARVGSRHQKRFRGEKTGRLNLRWNEKMEGTFRSMALPLQIPRTFLSRIFHSLQNEAALLSYHAQFLTGVPGLSPEMLSVMGCGLAYDMSKVRRGLWVPSQWVALPATPIFP